MTDHRGTAARVEVHAEGAPHRDDELPLSQLLRELAADGRRLVKDEIDLAKLELRHTARAAATDGGLVGAGAVVTLLGAACLVAALVIGLGILVGSYWIGALLVGIGLLFAGVLTLLKGLGRLRSGRIKPEKTIESLREDVAWVGDEVRAIRRDWQRS